MRSLIFTIAILLAWNVHASCDVFDQVKDAGLYENDAFWEDFAQISAKGQPSTAQVKALVDKHKAGTKTQASSANPTPTTPNSPQASLVGNRQVKLHHDAEKHLERAPKQVQERFDDLLRLVDEKGAKSAVQDLKTKGWDYHLIHEKNMYAVKLNGGYRALLEVKDGVMHIRDIGQHLYKH